MADIDRERTKLEIAMHGCMIKVADAAEAAYDEEDDDEEERAMEALWIETELYKRARKALAKCYAEHRENTCV